MNADPFHRHRAELRYHCYQLLGSFADADDVVQETFARALTAADAFEGRASVRTWLFRIATHACIDELRRRKRRRLVSTRPPNGAEDEVLAELDVDRWIQPFPDDLLPDRRYARVEAVTLAFVEALQRLPPRQRAVLVLRDSLDWSAEEVAALLDMTPAAVHASLLRARAQLTARRKPPPRRAGDLALARAFAAAFARGDVDALAGMLRRDVELHMPPYELWMRGRDELLAFVQRRIWAGRSITCTVTHANGAVAVVLADRGAPFAVTLLAAARGRIARIHAYVMPALAARFSAARTGPRARPAA